MKMKIKTENINKKLVTKTLIEIKIKTKYKNKTNLKY